MELAQSDGIKALLSSVLYILYLKNKKTILLRSMDTSKPPVCLCSTCGHAGDTLACVSSLCRECKKKFFTFIYVLKI